MREVVLFSISIFDSVWSNRRWKAIGHVWYK